MASKVKYVKRKIVMSASMAHQRINDHEKLCRIMQRQTHERLRELSRQIERLEKVLFTVAGLIIIGLLTLVYDKLL